MLRHKHIDRICCIVLVVTLLLTCVFIGSAATGVIENNTSMGYENRLFDQSKVHTIDIVMNDWEGFLATCTNEEYTDCTVVIDGEKYGNVGIRAKGNTSLSSVAAYGNNRYSFKLELDHYETGKNYYGLDKISLNNLIQDKTYMKDYVSYTLMNKMGVAAPLCSFVQINVNGDPWGLYLAVEGVEEGFLKRNYGNNYGKLYKPDSLSFGGGRGNGMDFDMDEFSESLGESADGAKASGASQGNMPQRPGGDFDPSKMFGEDFDPSAMFGGGDFPAMPEGGFEFSGMPDMGGMGGFGVGSEDVKLQYIDDDPESYPNIFDSAKTKIKDSDKKRLIASLKTLSEGEDIESVVDVDAVIRYLVVHNFLCNDDSYTGTMIHNYYLYEENGVLSMIPWDYNLAFGGFSMGGPGDTDNKGATSTVNSPIDSPVSMGSIDTRPMIAWIFQSEEYTARYHEIYQEFVDTVFKNGWFQEEMTAVTNMIAPYVEKDTTAFFTYEEYENAVDALLEFSDLRAKSIDGQLNGSIPSTTEGQQGNPEALVDASHIALTDMGEFGTGGGMPDMSGGTPPDDMGSFGGSLGTPPADFDPALLGDMSGLPEGMPDMSGGTPPDGMGSFGGSSGTPPTDMNAAPAGNTPSPTDEAPDATITDAASLEDDIQPTATASGSDAPEETDAPNTMGPVPNGFNNGGGQNKSNGTNTNNYLMLIGCAVLLVLAIVFAKFYKTNR